MQLADLWHVSDTPELRRGLLAQYVVNHGTNKLAVPLACLLIGLLLMQWESPWLVAAWIGVSWLFSFIGALVYQRFGDGEKIDPNQLWPWMVAIAVPRLLFILTWASMAFWAWTHDNPETFFVVMTILVSTMAMNASQSGAFLPFYFMELIPKITAMLIVSLSSSDVLHLTFAGLALIGAVFFTKIAFAINKSTRTILSQKYELARAKEEVEQASKAKSAFLATMSHEVRTPLNGVLGVINLLRDTPLTEAQAEHIETIRYSGETLLTMLNDVLDFSKMEAGKLSIEKVAFETPRLVQSVINLMWSRAGEKGLTISMQMTDNVPFYIASDPTRLRQVLLNLVGNAIKFTERGTISIFVRRADNLAPPGPNMAWLHFEVIDPGIGIPNEAQANLFSEFTQVDSSISRRYGGTGLGLSICKRIVNQMGGEIGVRSRWGEGSTFWFDIPVEIASGVSTSAEDEGMPRLSPLKVLLAEDNKVNQHVTVGILEKYGHTVDVAEDGRQAVAAVNRKKYDVVLMDMQMPGVDGLQATREIKAMGGAYAQVPIIALTANTLRGDDERCLAAGMVDHVAKPINPTELFKALARQFPDKVTGYDLSVSLPIQANKASQSLEQQLDQQNIDALKKVLGPEFVKNFMLSYMPELQGQLNNLVAAYKNHNHDVLLQSSHDLKSLSAMFGLHQVSTLAEGIEMACLQRGDQEIGPMIDRLKLRFTEEFKALQTTYPN